MANGNGSYRITGEQVEMLATWLVRVVLVVLAWIATGAIRDLRELRTDHQALVERVIRIEAQRDVQSREVERRLESIDNSIMSLQSLITTGQVRVIPRSE